MSHHQINRPLVPGWTNAPGAVLHGVRFKLCDLGRFQGASQDVTPARSYCRTVLGLGDFVRLFTRHCSCLCPNGSTFNTTPSTQESYHIICGSKNEKGNITRWLSEDGCGEKNPSGVDSQYEDGECVPFLSSGGDSIYVRLQCNVVPDDANRTEAFIVSLVANLIFAAILYLIYALVRPHFKRLYFPRLADSDVSRERVAR